VGGRIPGPSRFDVRRSQTNGVGEWRSLTPSSRHDHRRKPTKCLCPRKSYDVVSDGVTYFNCFLSNSMYVRKTNFLSKLKCSVLIGLFLNVISMEMSSLQLNYASCMHLIWAWYTTLFWTSLFTTTGSKKLKIQTNNLNKQTQCTIDKQKITRSDVT